MSDGITNELQSSLDVWHTLTPEERVDAFQQLPYSEKGDFFLALSARDQYEKHRKKNAPDCSSCWTISPDAKSWRCLPMRKTTPAA